MNYNKYVNVFNGCGEYNIPKRDGISAKWFFIKAGCGNTSPAACVPFGAMSVSPYTGGYPTGYGDHKPNSFSKPIHFREGKGIIGFSHLQQSGTGAIGYYYNYAVVTPRYESSPFRRKFSKEFAEPGYYSCNIEDIKCEITASEKVAFHKYKFGSSDGQVLIDFSNNGLNIPGDEKQKVEKLNIKNDGSMIFADAIIEGVKIYFAVSYNGKAEIKSNKVIISNFGKESYIKLSISLRSNKIAVYNIQNSFIFEDAKKYSYSKWNEYLSRIRIDTTDDNIKQIFYSNLYHSLIKPSDWTGESFIYESDDSFCTDLATLWDMYKTCIPLIMMAYPKEGKLIADTLLNIGEKLGKIPNSIGITTAYLNHSTQARMLGTYALITAVRYGLDVDPYRLIDIVTTDVFNEDNKDFIEDGKCNSNTFMLDMADGCRLISDLASQIGRYDVCNKLKSLSEQWKNVYSKETGLLNNDTDYYEGTLYNYSFRQMVDMGERISIAGGNERFVSLLDNFFGYGSPDTILQTDPYDYKPIEYGMRLGRFEGFNNESDTEAPFSYIYAGRQDRTCEILRSGMSNMFSLGRGGLPGNNDSGALSSYYVLAAMGIFPVAGQDLFLIGSPFIDKAEIDLFNDKKLTIIVDNNSSSNIYVKNVSFNGKNLDNYMIKASLLLNGGTLHFEMSDKKAII